MSSTCNVRIVPVVTFPVNTSLALVVVTGPPHRVRPGPALTDTGGTGVESASSTAPSCPLWALARFTLSVPATGPVVPLHARSSPRLAAIVARPKGVKAGLLSVQPPPLGQPVRTPAWPPSTAPRRE